MPRFTSADEKQKTISPRQRKIQCLSRNFETIRAMSILKGRGEEEELGKFVPHSQTNGPDNGLDLAYIPTPWLAMETTTTPWR